MGRKIPGKKHHGVKDPLEQLARRNESLKLKINAPPTNPDEQEMPKRLLELKRLRDMVKEGKFSGKKPKHKKRNKLLDTHKIAGYDPKLPGMKRPDKVIPKLVQWPGESDQRFLERVDEVTQDIINEVKYEKKYEMNIDKNESGKNENVQTKQRHKLLIVKEPQKNKKKEQEDLADNFLMKRSLNRRQRLKLKKKSQQDNQEMDFKDFTDTVKFGEVAHQPPNLKVRPRGSDTLTSARPGCKSLLLNTMLTSSQGKNSAKTSISMAAQRRLETQRLDAVAAYRAIKANRSKLKT